LLTSAGCYNWDSWTKGGEEGKKGGEKDKTPKPPALAESRPPDLKKPRDAYEKRRKRRERKKSHHQPRSPSFQEGYSAAGDGGVQKKGGGEGGKKEPCRFHPLLYINPDGVASGPVKKEKKKGGGRKKKKLYT